MNLGCSGAASPTCLERRAEGTGGEVQGEAGSQRALEAVVRRRGFTPREMGATVLSRRVTRSYLL